MPAVVSGGHAQTEEGRLTMRDRFYVIGAQDAPVLHAVAVKNVAQAHTP